MINDRKQVLLQDDITASQSIMWRIHTNATVTVDTSGTSATMKIGDKTVQMVILNPTSEMKITTGPAERFSDDPALPTGQVDQPNPGVTVVMINADSGTKSIQVLFNPQWSGMDANAFVTPKSVSLSDWSLTSHS